MVKSYVSRKDTSTYNLEWSHSHRRAEEQGWKNRKGIYAILVLPFSLIVHSHGWRNLFDGLFRISASSYDPTHIDLFTRLIGPIAEHSFNNYTSCNVACPCSFVDRPRDDALASSALDSTGDSHQRPPSRTPIRADQGVD